MLNLGGRLNLLRARYEWISSKPIPCDLSYVNYKCYICLTGSLCRPFKSKHLNWCVFKRQTVITTFEQSLRDVAGFWAQLLIEKSNSSTKTQVFFFLQSMSLARPFFSFDALGWVELGDQTSGPVLICLGFSLTSL